MSNTEATAKSWVQALASRTELPFAGELVMQFSHARITRLCECGCRSFECHVEQGSGLNRLFADIGELSSFEAAFASNAGEPIDVVFYADERGMLSGIDVHLGVANHAPMPDNVLLGHLLYTVPVV